MPQTSAVVLFTAKSADRIIREGGTSSWRLDRNNARRCTYAVCVRNAHADWGDGNEQHHEAFLVGKGIRRRSDRRDSGKQRITERSLPDRI